MDLSGKFFWKVEIFSNLSRANKLVELFLHLLQSTKSKWKKIKILSVLQVLLELKDVRAHRYCASLVRTLYMTWREPRHVFQPRAPSRNSTKYRLMTFAVTWSQNIFVGCSVTPTFFFGRSLPFLILSIMLKNKKICVWEVLIISHILFK